MTGKLRLTLACGDYEIVRALKEGIVQPDGIDLVLLTGMGSKERHWRMARKADFDACEVNADAYFMGRDRGEPLAAIPVFLHRRFRHGFVFVNAAAGIRTPKDPIGKKIGGTNFQPASNIWMHVTVIKQEIVDKYPWVATDLTKAFEQAKNLAYARIANPRVVPLAWIRTAWEEQEQVLGPDPWMYGLGPANRKNLEAILRYTRNQGLVRKGLSIDDLFLDTDLGDAGGPDEPF